MQIRTSVVAVGVGVWIEHSFRLVQIRTSVVVKGLSWPHGRSFRLVQIRTSVVVLKVLQLSAIRFRLVQIRTSVVGQSWQNNQWYSVIKHQTYFIDALMHILYHFQAQMSIESGYFT